jgi:hypothetical protein
MGDTTRKNRVDEVFFGVIFSIQNYDFINFATQIFPVLTSSLTLRLELLQAVLDLGS